MEWEQGFPLKYDHRLILIQIFYLRFLLLNLFEIEYNDFFFGVLYIVLTLDYFNRKSNCPIISLTF
jgi:hypothetical protein